VHSVITVFDPSLVKQIDEKGKVLRFVFGDLGKNEQGGSGS